MAPQSSHKTAVTNGLMESSEQNTQDDAFPRVSMTETPELDYLSSSSESDYPQVSLSKRGGMMLRGGGPRPRAEAKSARKNAKRVSSGTHPTPKLEPADVIMKRIIHDSAFRKADYIVGYHDRHCGTMERALADWFRDGVEDEEFIPEHRIEYIKRTTDDCIVWDRSNKIDLIKRSGVTGLSDAD
ncbi:MAG: hypothetical protein Q9222_007349 [Ikaeria aurantiellina]